MKNLSFAKKINLFIWTLLIIGAGAFTFTTALTVIPAYNVGYFLAETDGWGGHVLDTGLDGMTSATPDGLIKFLQGKYVSSDKQEHTGASFIVNTMLGRAKGPKSKSLSQSDWDSLKAYLDEKDAAKLIQWDAWVSCSSFKQINSYYQGIDGSSTATETNPDDDAFYLDETCNGETDNVIYIKNFDGTFAYALKYICANPVGDINNKNGWSVTPTAKLLSSNNVVVGQPIKWSHTVTLNGSEKSDKTVDYYYNTYVNGSWKDKGTVKQIPSGTAPVFTDSFNSIYTTTAEDLGKTICRTTGAIPQAKGNSLGVESSRECATVVQTVDTNSCRPIIIKAQDPNWANTTGEVYNGTSGGEKIYVTIKVYNKKADGTIGALYKTYTTVPGDPDPVKIVNGDSVNINSDCTTGSEYIVRFSTTNYTWDTYTVTKHHSAANGGGTYEVTKGCTRSDAFDSKAKSCPSGKDDTTDHIWPEDKIGPCYDYILKPSISTISPYRVEVGTSVTFNPVVLSESWTYNFDRTYYDLYNPTHDPTKLHTKSRATEWQVSRLKIVPNGKLWSDSQEVAPTAVTAVNPCDYYKSKGFNSCAAEKTGKDTIISNISKWLSGDKIFDDIKTTIGDEPAGTKVCFALSVKPSDSETSVDWSHSSVQKTYCVVVVEKPKVQVLGGDIKVGRSFSSTSAYFIESNILTTNSVKTVNGKLMTYGSWAEYALAAPGLIRGMASGSAFNGGMAADTALGVAATCKYSTLSFSNSTSASGCSPSATIGSYSFNKKTIPDVSSSFPLSSVSSQKLSGNVNLDSLATGSYTANGNITITGGTLSAGKWIVINAPTITVKIANDVTYTASTLKSLNDIPQLVIIAKNIQISNKVSRIDSWLIAKDGTLNTCSENMAGKLSTNDCKNLLTVNGPVMASELSLRRTAGSGTANRSGDPAEVFNLRADAYLWAYARASGSGRVWTVYTTNVPPRL